MANSSTADCGKENSSTSIGKLAQHKLASSQQDTATTPSPATATTTTTTTTTAAAAVLEQALGCNVGAEIGGDGANAHCDAVAGNDSLENQPQAQAQAQLRGKFSQPPARKGIDEHSNCPACCKSLRLAKFLVSVSNCSLRWHSACFKCAACRQQLDTAASCYLYRHKILCKFDYERAAAAASSTLAAGVGGDDSKGNFEKLDDNNDSKRQVPERGDEDLRGGTCAACKWQISATDWVRRAGSHVYHLACFACDVCRRQLNTGEQFGLWPPAAGGQVGDKSQVRLICKVHFDSFKLGARDDHKATAPASSQDARSRLWSRRRQKPSGPPSTVQKKQRRTSCKSGGELATASKQPLSVEAVSLAGAISPGGRRAMSPSPSLSPSSLISQSMSPAVCSPPTAMHTVAPPAGAATSTLLNAQQTQMPSFSSTNSGGGLFRPDHHQPHTHAHAHAHHLHSHHAGSQLKTKRVRTTFTEEQLAILQTNFKIDSNPDGQDLERIAAVTGLSKRVTQVWFQNSRARQKKYLIKRRPSHGGGVPLQCSDGGVSNSGEFADFSAATLTVGGANISSKGNYPPTMPLPGGCHFEASWQSDDEDIEEINECEEDDDDEE